MDLQNMDLQGGSLQISTEVVGKIARCAALEVDGVAEVSCGVQNKKLKSLLESASIQLPVVVEMRDGTASITLHLMMQFGARIPSVAEKVQENVKSAVQNMTNVTVSRVDLSLQALPRLSNKFSKKSYQKRSSSRYARRGGFVLRKEHYGKYSAP